MIEYLILLLSTDWFLPYWTEIGIELDEEKKIEVQRGCRRIVDQITDGDSSLFLRSFSTSHRGRIESSFRSLLQASASEPQVSAIAKEWDNLSHKQLTAVWMCAMFNGEILAADGSATEPSLEFPIRAAVAKTWETYALSASTFQDISSASRTEWDKRIRTLLVSPKSLANQLWRVVLDHRLRAFWAEVRQRLTPDQLYKLVSWYHAMMPKNKLGQAESAQIPSYMQ